MAHKYDQFYQLLHATRVAAIAALDEAVKLNLPTTSVKVRDIVNATQKIANDVLTKIEAAQVADALTKAEYDALANKQMAFYGEIFEMTRADGVKTLLDPEHVTIMQPAQAGTAMSVAQLGYEFTPDNPMFSGTRLDMPVPQLSAAQLAQARTTPLPHVPVRESSPGNRHSYDTSNLGMINMAFALNGLAHSGTYHDAARPADNSSCSDNNSSSSSDIGSCDTGGGGE